MRCLAGGVLLSFAGVLMIDIADAPVPDRRYRIALIGNLIMLTLVTLASPLALIGLSAL